MCNFCALNLGGIPRLRRRGIVRRATEENAAPPAENVTKLEKAIFFRI